MDYNSPVFRLLATNSPQSAAQLSGSPQALRLALSHCSMSPPQVEQDSEAANELVEVEEDRMNAAAKTFKQMTPEQQTAFSASVISLYQEAEGADLMLTLKSFLP